MISVSRSNSDPMNESLGVIEAEHAALAAILSGLRYFVRAAGRGIAPDPDLLTMMLDYVEQFPERLHHPHEDEHLFRRLRARTHEADDMLDRLEADHAAGAENLARVRSALNAWKASGAPALPELAQRIETYTAAYLSHMNAEERWILPLARQHLVAEDWRALHAAFCTAEDPLTTEAASRAFAELFHRIALLAPAPVGLR